MRAPLALAAALSLAACSGGDPGGTAAQPVPVAPEGGAGTGAEDPPPDHPGHPGPLRAVAGLPGFHLRARRVFDGAPDLPHRFEALHLFPGRAHWQTWNEATPELRHIEYRFGDALCFLPPGTAESRVHGGDARRAVARNMELLVAVVMWPDGLAWEGTGALRTAPLPPLAGEALGTLAAELDAGGRPVRVAVLGPDGAELEALSVPSWREHDGRGWPAELELHFGGERIWRQTLEPIETRVFAAESFFVPADRR